MGLDLKRREVRMMLDLWALVAAGALCARA